MIEVKISHSPADSVGLDGINVEGIQDLDELSGAVDKLLERNEFSPPCYIAVTIPESDMLSTGIYFPQVSGIVVRRVWNRFGMDSPTKYEVVKNNMECNTTIYTYFGKRYEEK